MSIRHVSKTTAFRSIRIRYDEADERGAALTTGDGLLDSLIGGNILEQASVYSASHNGEVHATIAFRNHSSAQLAYDKISSVGHPGFKVDTHFHGLTILHSPREYEVDICAVHGLGGHAIESFLCDTTLWLRDHLSWTKPFDTARMMTFGFDSQLTNEDPSGAISNWAESLLESFKGIRNPAGNTCAPTPLLFVCHSTGGWVVRHAIERLYQWKDGHHSAGISLHNCGILFLSTPCFETSQGQLANAFAESMSVLTGINSNCIADQLQNFGCRTKETIEIWRSMNVEGVMPPFECLSESRETRVGKRNIQLVTLNNAGFMGQKAMQIANTDHHEVCRYKSRFSHAYKDLIGRFMHLRSSIFQINAVNFVQISDRPASYSGNAHPITNTTAVPRPASFPDASVEFRSERSLGAQVGASYGVINNTFYYGNEHRLPGQPNATAPRYPLARDRKSYFGSSLKFRTGHFKGRRDVLKNLCNEMNIAILASDGKLVALSGIGGIGKTEILLEYGLISRETNHIFHCQASPGESLQFSLYKLASAVGSETLNPRIVLADRETVWRSYGQEQRVEAFVRWLQDFPVEDSQCLILIDDVDAFQNNEDIEYLSAVLRAWPHSVLMTTRDPELGVMLADSSDKDQQVYTIHPLSEQELEPIMRRFVGEGLDISSADVRSIAQLMQGHAMASCRAIQFICQELILDVKQAPIERFIQAFDVNSSDYELRGRFLNFQPRLGKSLATCFETSIQRLGSTERLASRLLNFAAYLVTPDVDFRLFFQHHRPWLSTITSTEHLRTKELFELNSTELLQALHRLTSTSALTRTKSGRLDLHPLMSEYLVQRQQPPGRIHVLRQIVLLCKASIILNEKKDIFEHFLTNCLHIAHRFRIDPAEIEPPPSILQSIKEHASPDDINTTNPQKRSTAPEIRTLGPRIQTLTQKRQTNTAILTDETQRQEHLNEARHLIFEFEQFRLTIPEGHVDPRLDDFLYALCDAMMGLVLGINPVYFHKMWELARELGKRKRGV